jgi:predicted RNA-binding protein with PUA-like domain
MNYWLVKSEPDVYSWEDLVKEKKSYVGWRAQFSGAQQLEGDEKR